MPLACKANALPSELHPLDKGKKKKREIWDKRKKRKKNSPTGIRTPVFHVTGEDTNQLYYWRLLIKRKGTAVKVTRVG